MNKITWGDPGHEHEFCVNFEEYGLFEGFIPDDVSSWIQKALSPYGFYVMNRGTRIEILPPQDWWKNIRQGDVEFVFDTVKALFPDREFKTYSRLDTSTK